MLRSEGENKVTVSEKLRDRKITTNRLRQKKATGNDRKVGRGKVITKIQHSKRSKSKDGK